MLKVKLIAHTPQPEKVVAAAAKLCYSSAGVDDLLDGLTPESSRAFVERLASLGHESPTEHAVFTFAIEGVSRSLLAQITRHRIASYSVQSQRYVNLHQFRYVTPPEIEGDEDALAAFRAAMDAQAQQYQQLAQAHGHGLGQLAGFVKGLAADGVDALHGAVQLRRLRPAEGQKGDGQRREDGRQRPGPVAL